MTLLDTIETVKAQTNSSFSKILPGLQLAVDNSSLDAVKKCPRYYQYSIIEGYRGTMSNPHLTFGSVFAASLERYARDRAEDIDHESALVNTLRFAITETWDAVLKRPWVSDEPTKTRNTLLRTIVWYLDTFKDQTLKTLILANGKPAVELSFRFDSGIETSYVIDCPACDGCGLAGYNENGSLIGCNNCEGSGKVREHFLLCGHIDRVVEFNGEIWITDNKTTKHDLNDNYFKQYTPNGQVSLYSIAGGFLVPLDEEIGGLIIDAAQVLVGGSRFRRRQIPRSEAQLEEYMQDLRTYLREMEDYAYNNYWPMRETSCHWEGLDASGKYACQYLPVCSSDPSIRQTLLDSMFTKRVWDPLQPR